MSHLEQFGVYVHHEPMTGCWLWGGALAKAGYGLLHVDGKTRSAHRVSWELHRGAIPDGALVCHRCDVRWCVNPSHLFLGNDMDNNHDMRKKGRAVAAGGIRLAGLNVCAAGHSIQAGNVSTAKDGHAQCRECKLRASRVRYDTDPAFREKAKARARERHARLYAADAGFRQSVCDRWKRWKDAHASR